MVARLVGLLQALIIGHVHAPYLDALDYHVEPHHDLYLTSTCSLRSGSPQLPMAVWYAASVADTCPQSKILHSPMHLCISGSGAPLPMDAVACLALHRLRNHLHRIRISLHNGSEPQHSATFTIIQPTHLPETSTGGQNEHSRV